MRVLTITGIFSVRALTAASSNDDRGEAKYALTPASRLLVGGVGDTPVDMSLVLRVLVHPINLTPLFGLREWLTDERAAGVSIFEAAHSCTQWEIRGEGHADGGVFNDTIVAPELYRDTPRRSPSPKEPALGDWVDRAADDNPQFGSSNSLPELGPDATQDLAFYQRSSPEQRWSWAGSVATEDSDDFEVATSCSSEQDMVRPASAPKAPGFANGGVSIARKAQPTSAKSTDIRGANPAKRTSLLQKKLNGTSQMPIKNGKQSAFSGIDGRGTPNGKASTKK